MPLPYIVLKRIASRSDGTFGVLMMDGNLPFAVTCERAWQNNEKMVSCIPAGTYLCKRVNSPKFGWTFQVMEVPDRSEILFHKGNRDDDTKGCIMTGESFSTWDDGSVSIAQSGAAFDEFMSRLKGHDEFMFQVIY